MALIDSIKRKVKGGANRAISLASHVPGARNVGAGISTGIGAITPAVGPLQDVRDAAFTAAHNATNPNVNIYGKPNPQPQKQAYPRAVQTMDTGGSVPDIPSGGIYGGGGSGSGSDTEYDPDLDPSKISAARGDIVNLTDIFDRALQDALGQVDVLAADKKRALVENYGKQRQTLQGNFANTSKQIDDMYSARGAYHSSYREGEQNTAENAFNDAMSGLDTAQASDEAQIGQFADTQKATLNAGRPNYNVNDYNTVSDLLDVKQTVDDAVKQLGITRAGLGTTSEYATNLNKIAPQQEAGSSALKAQLERIAGVNAPTEAKRAIAAQMIGDAGDGNDTEYLDYFERLLQQQGSQAVATA